MNPAATLATCTHAVEAARDAYADVGAALAHAHAGDDADRAVALAQARELARDLGSSMLVVARTLEHLGADARQCLDAYALAASIALLDAPSFADLLSRPLVDPARMQPSR